MKAGLKPAEIAERCNVTSNSIRNWSREFRAYLSPGANASERFYTERDATVLQYISTLKKEGMKATEIIERLAETTFGDVESVEITQEESVAPITNQPTAPEVPETAFLPLQVVEHYSALEKRFDARFEALERSRRDAVFYSALGLIAGLLLAGIFEMFAWLYLHIR